MGTTAVRTGSLRETESKRERGHCMGAGGGPDSDRITSTSDANGWHLSHVDPPTRSDGLKCIEQGLQGMHESITPNVPY